MAKKLKVPITVLIKSEDWNYFTLGLTVKLQESQQCGSGKRIDKLINGIKSLKTNPQKYSQLIFEAREIQWKKDTLLNKLYRINWTYMYQKQKQAKKKKRKTKCIPHIVYQNNNN